MRLIDVDALKQIHGMKDDCAECDKELRGKSKSCEYDRTYTLMDFCGWLDDMPTIKPERKTGKWDDIGGIIRYGCPFCHHAYESMYNYFVQEFGAITKSRALEMFRTQYDIDRDRAGW